MKKTRRRFTTAFKTKVVLEALKERSALQELAKRFELSPVQIAQWKKEFLANAEKAFAGDSVEKDDALEKENEQLYNQVGRLKMEVEWLKKKVL